MIPIELDNSGSGDQKHMGNEEALGEHFPAPLASTTDPAVLDLLPHLICSNSPFSSSLSPKEQKLRATSHQPLPRLKRHNPKQLSISH